jgi:hypothetical protein
MGGNLNSALAGAVSGALFGAAGAMTTPTSFASYAAHAAAGCASAAASGGSCGSGAAGAVVGKLFTNLTVASLGQSSPGAHFAGAVIGGGMGSLAAGGRFQDGAFSAGLGYLFNECGHGGCFKDRTHNFDYTQKLCNTGDSWCTADRAMDAHKRYGFPGQREDQVIDSSAQRFTVRGGPVVVGPITSQSPDGGITVFNQTQPGHWFHNGSVTRSLVFREDGIYMRTVGAGVNVNGFWARANTGLSNPGFYTLNDDLRNYMRHQFYRDRAGR